MYKILIVEDTLAIREEICDILLMEGYAVFQAENGKIGFEMALKELPDLIISDILMPHLNGIEMFKKLQKDENTIGIPLIFLSAKGEKADVRIGMNVGAEDYLIKPVNTDELINVVKRKLKRQQLIKDNLDKRVEENEYLLKAAGKTAKIGYWTYDKQTDIRSWSKAVHQVFATDPKEGIPKREEVLNCFHKKPRQQLIRATKNLVIRGVSYDIELELTNVKNENRWIQDIGEPIYDNENEIIGSRGIIRDITILKKDQEELKKANERYELVSRATNDLVWDWDLLTDKVYRNKESFQKVFGFYDNNLMEIITNWVDYIHPDDKNRIKKLLKEITHSADVTNFSLEYRFLPPNGDSIYVCDEGFVLRDKNGKAIRMIGAASNITERKKLELLMANENQAMEKIATNEPLVSILEALTLTIEKYMSHSLCSILLLDSDGVHLRQGAAPSLPIAYNLAIDGLATGENRGSSGTAVYRKELVIVSDIATDPLWINYKELALSNGLKSCWSMPIISNEDKVLGTFAIYYPTIMMPKSTDIELLKRISNYVRIAIEKNKATMTLIKSETKYRHLFEQNLSGVYQATIDGTILSCNSTFAQMMGYLSPEDVLKQNAGKLYFFDSDREKYIKELKKNKKLINREVVLKHKNGKAIYLMENCYLETDPITKTVIIEGVFVDITALKKNEIALEETNANLNGILNSTTNGFMVVDLDGKTDLFNEKFKDLWQIPENILATMDDEKLLDVALGLMKDPQKFLEKVKELYANIEASSEDIIELKSGRVLERESQPKIMNGRITGRVWSFRDITARVKADKEKQQLFALVESSEDLISFGTSKGKPTFINKAGRKMLGISQIKSLSKFSVSDFFSPEDRDLAFKKMQKGFEDKGMWEGDTFLQNIKTKEKKAISISAFVIKDNITGIPIGMASICMDITERTIIKNELIAAKEQAEKLVGFKNQFLARMSHEIRTPLSVIIGFTKILMRSSITKKQKEQLTAIKVSSDILLVVINDVLDLAKMEAGKMVLEKTEIELFYLISSILGTFELQFQEKEQTFQVHYDERIPKQALGDPVRINQILLNLIGNAIKFAGKGGVINVHVNLVKQDDEKVFIEIKISDNGIGIPKDKIENVFDSFTQVETSTTRNYGGSGLGLNIVKQLIDLMEGTISVKSKLQVGSTFTFTIPLTKITGIEITTDQIVSNDNKLDLQARLKGLEKLKILIVDDMVINQLLAQTIMEDIGFETEVAENGKIAIQLLEKNNYDIILMDLQMPEMDGWEATEHIRNKMKPPKSTIPIIALSADVTQRNADKCKEAGMDEYVSKPINETDLLLKVTDLVIEKRNAGNKKQQALLKTCNLDGLKSHLRNNPELIAKMLQVILKETPVVVKQINKYLAAADWSSLHANIHKIKPTLDLMGLPKDITFAALQIEKYAKEESHVVLIPGLLLKLEKALEQAYTELEEELKLM